MIIKIHLHMKVDVVTIENNKAASIQVEASAKVMDDNIVHEIITDLKNIGVVDKTP